MAGSDNAARTAPAYRANFSNPHTRLRRSHASGVGQIRPDGSLRLVQRVEDEGKPPFDRVWQIRAVAPGRYVGTMSQASGPVTIEDFGGKYLFRFKMDGHVSVE